MCSLPVVCDLLYFNPSKWQQFYSRVSQEDEGRRVESDRPGCIVSNHVSYLDILYHMSASFPSFVAKVSHSPTP